MIRLIQNIIFLVFVFAVGYFFGVKGVRFYIVVSGSMEPTLMKNDRIASIRVDRIRRGDIVMLKDPEGSRELLTKRVIGLPGEHIKIMGGDVLVDGALLSEPYLEEQPTYLYEADLPEGSYLVLGDNRNESEDGHVWGPIPRGLVIGRVTCRYWPWQRFGFFAAPRD